MRWLYVLGAIRVFPPARPFRCLPLQFRMVAVWELCLIETSLSPAHYARKDRYSGIPATHGLSRLSSGMKSTLASHSQIVRGKGVVGSRWSDGHGTC